MLGHELLSGVGIRRDHEVHREVRRIPEIQGARPARSGMTSGDGWTSCAQGHRHWGRYGAAGLLLVREGQVLLQLRSPSVHRGGTWSIPGGARNDDESAADAALRETHEEIGLPVGQVDVREPGVIDDHGGWSYTTILGRLRPEWSAVRLRNNFESEETRWVARDEVRNLPLHPGFASSWPVVLDVIAEDL